VNFSSLLPCLFLLLEGVVYTERERESLWWAVVGK